MIKQLIIFLHVTIAAGSPADNAQTDSLPVCSVWLYTVCVNISIITQSNNSLLELLPLPRTCDIYRCETPTLSQLASLSQAEQHPVDLIEHTCVCGWVSHDVDYIFSSYNLLFFYVPSCGWVNLPYHSYDV